ncbi:hypothetical protein DI09_33p200 [Mitosporidium daphniae]|uniref:Uncharacterized protein n=1 Tax=Mitosporidium daphniae TaxID=1485682 RepID=A0A098VR33_9MICR|nr:uncharacterized protein DI09_33p200 [Mitosporidium daphniae]KGG51503.1 hypothetical protein DI09_33p200 [Mitosporidium daphniae]|eukprot:XP_013237930.1 uncharacterized protein DI09_33p200 [Mitosporidium daphniae]
MVGVSYLQDDAHKNVGRSDKSSPPPSAVANATSPHTPSLLSTSQPMMRRGDLGKHHIVGGGKTFRSRKIDFNKEITVLLESAEPEEHLLQMRSVPLLSTGVEKEEEDEAHLKAILSSAPTFSRMGGGEGARIPVPDSTDVGHSISGEIYEQLYPPTGEAFKKDERWKTPPQPRILDALHNPFYSNHGPAGLYCQNNLLGFGYGTRAPMTLLPCEGETIKGRTLPYVPYWATGDDLIFLTKLTPRLDISTFEKVMWVIESIALVFGHDGVVNSNFLTTKQAVVFIDRWLDPSELKIALSYQSAIFEHWKKTRAAISPSLVVPLLPTLKLEDQQGKIGNSSSSGSANSNIDPYVCFRRREIRQPRKTRRADLEALTKLSRLQEQFEDLLLLLRISLQRDQLKKSLLLEGTLVFGNTFTLESLKSKYGIHVPPIQISASESSNHRHIGHHHGQGSLISSHGRAVIHISDLNFRRCRVQACLMPIFSQEPI